jgi:hypothetical protein
VSGTKLSEVATTLDRWAFRFEEDSFFQFILSSDMVIRINKVERQKSIKPSAEFN